MQRFPQPLGVELGLLRHALPCVTGTPARMKIGAWFRSCPKASRQALRFGYWANATSLEVISRIGEARSANETDTLRLRLVSKRSVSAVSSS